jgi:glycosyltransferase involved in cell wall biosynthesis
MKNNPMLSIIMTNFNYSKWIGQAIHSVLSQTYSPTEMIIVDDGSTDNSVEIIKEYQKKHKNLKLLQNEKNMGVMYSLKRCLNEISGEYVYPISSDDYVLPDFFEKTMGLLIKYPGAGLCFSDLEVFDNGSNRKMIISHHLASKALYYSPKDLVRILKKEPFTCILGPTVIFKHTALIEAGGYIPELKWSSDAFAYHVIGFRYGACYMPEALSAQRIHTGQYSSGIEQKEKEREIIRNIFDQLLSPKYADVLPFFMRSAPISGYPWEVLRVALQNREYKRFVSFKLVRFALYDKIIRRPLLYIIPKKWARNIINFKRRMKLLIGISDAAHRD